MTLPCRRHREPGRFRCALLIVVVLWPVAAAAQAWVATDICAIAGVTVSRATANAVSGLWKYANGAWSQLHTSGPAGLATGRLH